MPPEVIQDYTSQKYYQTAFNDIYYNDFHSSSKYPPIAVSRYIPNTPSEIKLDPLFVNMFCENNKGPVTACCLGVRELW